MEIIIHTKTHRDFVATIEVVLVNMLCKSAGILQVQDGREGSLGSSIVLRKGQ